MNDELNPEQLGELLGAAGRLPHEMEPSRDAWPEIRRRIEARRVVPIGPAPTGRRGIRPMVFIAAAAGIVILIGIALQNRNSSATGPGQLANNPPVKVSTPAQPPARDSVSPGRSATPDLQSSPVPAKVVSLDVANPQLAASLDRYAASVRDLERDVASREAGLSPHTREVVKRSLATIDSAIADLRAAVGASPKDAQLGESLTTIYERKLEFLRRVKSLPGEGE